MTRLTSHGFLKHSLGQRHGLVLNPAIRQGFLELLDAFVGDLGVGEFQRLEAGQAFDVLQAGVGDLGAREEHLYDWFARTVLVNLPATDLLP